MQCKGYKDNDCTDCFYPMQLNSGKCICEPGLVVYYPRMKQKFVIFIVLLFFQKRAEH